VTSAHFSQTQIKAGSKDRSLASLVSSYTITCIPPDCGQRHPVGAGLAKASSWALQGSRPSSPASRSRSHKKPPIPTATARRRPAEHLDKLGEEAHGASLSTAVSPKYFDNPPVICNDNFVSVLIVFATLAFYRKHVM
jgi:hypothetical protein